jgi:L-Ala-D/L-Glu epimerase / N-acetyl-D-glutamate racemase
VPTEPMSSKRIGRLAVSAQVECWPLREPFRITGYTWEAIEVVLVRLEHQGEVGWGEASGVYYRGETAASMVQQIESLRTQVEAGISRDSLQTLLPPGGARNALDCALWDLEAHVTRRAAWQIAGLDSPRPLLTTYTCSAQSPEKMARAARVYQSARAIKIKLTGEPSDADRVCAVREARPDVWLGVDANQGFTRHTMERLMPTLTHAGVQLIEQPFPIGREALLDGFRSPIPVAADESAQSLADLPGLAGRFDVINIKLDKCGGLTEGLALVRAARELGLQSMVGNMIGTSLAMAPAFLVGQLCTVVDLDGPVFLKTDRAAPAEYDDGRMSCPERLWGGGARSVKQPKGRSLSLLPRIE